MNMKDNKELRGFFQEVKSWTLVILFFWLLSNVRIPVEQVGVVWEDEDWVELETVISEDNIPEIPELPEIKKKPISYKKRTIPMNFQDTTGLSMTHEEIVTVTVYNPTPEQCDSNPLMTASGSKIDTDKLESGELRWLAVSQDLRSKYKYGDKVLITGTGVYDGIWIVKDTMNKRWKNKIDLLRPITENTGKWTNIKIQKIVEENTV